MARRWASRYRFEWPCSLTIKSWDSVPETNFQMCAASQVSPDTVLRLLLPEDHGARGQGRSYSMEELKELLNKLMLMSGKKDLNSSAEVEKFSEVSIRVWAAAHRGCSGSSWARHFRFGAVERV